MTHKVYVEFTQEDLDALSAFLDAGVKSIGLASVKQAAGLLDKLEKAVATANHSKLNEAE